MQSIKVNPLPTTLLSSLSKYMFHIRLPFSSSLWMKPELKSNQRMSQIYWQKTEMCVQIIFE